MASFFHTLRDDFPDYLDDAARLRPETALWQRLAAVGFSLVSPGPLDFADSNYVESCLRRFPERPALHAFAALALGVLMGKLEEGAISEIDLICDQDDLHVFLRENEALLEARYGEARV